MITISKGDHVAGLPDLIVSSASGEYADVDLILCARRDAPNFDAAMYQAQFIRYGEIVYQHETPEALGAAIIAIDPESTHDAAQLWREDEARRLAREKGTLTPGDPAPAPDAVQAQEEVLPEEKEAVPEEEEDDVKFFKEEEQQNQASSTPQTPEVPEERDMPVIDVDPPEGEVAGTASSTPPAPEPELPVVPIEEPILPVIPEEPVPLDTSSTTSQ